MRGTLKWILGAMVVAFAGTLFAIGCSCTAGSQPAPVQGPAEKAGAALDKAVKKSADAAKNLVENTGTAAKDALNKASEKAGEALEKAGAQIEKKGAELQSDQTTRTGP